MILFAITFRAHFDIPWLSWLVDAFVRKTSVLAKWFKMPILSFYVGTWFWVRKPAEFKHINKRRSKN